MKTRLALALIVGLMVTFGHERRGLATLTIVGGSADTNDRFTTSGNFFASGLDFSSVGRTQQAGGTFSQGDRMMTVISPHFALAAYHYLPGVGNTIAFSSGNGATTFTDTVANTFKLSNSGPGGNGSELALVQFANAVPNQYIAPIAANDPSALENHQIYVYGQGIVIGGARSDYVGLNNITPLIQYDDNGTDVPLPSFVTDLTDTGTGRDGIVYFFDFNNPQSPYYDPSAPGPYEAYVQGGDSSAPSFVNLNGTLALVGVHWFQYDGYNSLNGSGDIYVSAYIDAINAKIQTIYPGESVTVLPVPEPASLVLVALGGLGLVLRRAGRLCRS